MISLLSGVGDAIQVLSRRDIRAQRRGVLVPIGVVEGIVRSRGAIHGCGGQQADFQRQSGWERA